MSFSILLQSLSGQDKFYVILNTYRHHKDSFLDSIAFFIDIDWKSTYVHFNKKGFPITQTT